MIANLAGADIRPGLDGPAAARRRGRRPAPVATTAAPRSPTAHVEVIDEPDVDGELALRPGWPSMFRGYLHDDERYRQVLRRRLVPHRRRRPARRRRLALVRRPRRRRHQVGRPPHRPVRGRERPDGAPGRRRGRRHRRPRPGRRRGRQGVRQPRPGLRAERRPAPRPHRPTPARRLGAAVAPRQIAFDQHLPKTTQRQDHAPPAQGPRARAARGRPVDAGGRRS